MAGETGFEKAACAFFLSLEVVARVRTVERFVAEREIRDDVVLDDSLQQRPLKPGRIAQVASLDLTVPQAEPNQNVAAEPLDDSHAFARLRTMPNVYSRRPPGKPVQYLVDQCKGLLDLAYANPDARIDIALVQHGHLKAQAIVGRVGEGAARIEGASGRPADVAAGGILPGQCGFEYAGIDGAILQRCGVVV